MKRLFHVFVLLGFCGTSYGQNWLNYNTPHFSPQILKQADVGFVNIYEIASQPVGDDASNSRVVRVVKYPTQSFSFDEDGKMIEKLVYKKDSDVIASKSVMSYQEDHMSEKHTWDYMYNSRANETVDTLLAMHRIQSYAYDEDQLVGVTAAEKDQEKQTVIEKTILSYGSDKEIQSIENQYLALGSNYTTLYEYQSNGLCLALRNDGLRTELSIDAKGRFSRIKQMLSDDSEQVSETENFYKDAQLDSTHAIYGNGDIEIGSGYYYDIEGKLVMIRIHHSEQGLIEKLFEYFPREERN